MLAVDDLRFAYPGGPEFVFSLALERGEIVTLSATAARVSRPWST
jgi:hypothetical protein